MIFYIFIFLTVWTRLNFVLNFSTGPNRTEPSEPNRHPPKAGVIYWKDLPTYDGEIIFPEARGVTPHIDTKQAKEIFFQNLCSRYRIKYIHTTPQGRDE